MLISRQIKRFLKLIPLLLLIGIRDIIPMLIRFINNGNKNVLHFEMVSSWCLFIFIVSALFYIGNLKIKNDKVEKIFRGTIASLCDIIFSDIERTKNFTNESTQLFLRTYMLEIKLITTTLILLYPFFESILTKITRKNIFSFKYKNILSVSISILRPLLLVWNCNLYILILIQMLEITFSSILASEIECDEVKTLHGEKNKQRIRLSNTIFAIIAPISLHLSIASVISFTYVRCLSNKCYWGSIGGKHTNVADIVIFANGLFKTIMYQIDINFSHINQWFICTLISLLSFIFHILGVQYSFYGILITIVFLDYFSDKVISNTFDDENAIAKGKDVPRMLLNLLKYTQNITPYIERDENKKFIGQDGVTLLENMVFWWCITTFVSFIIFGYGTIYHMKIKNH